MKKPGALAPGSQRFLAVQLQELIFFSLVAENALRIDVIDVAKRCWSDLSLRIVTHEAVLAPLELVTDLGRPRHDASG